MIIMYSPSSGTYSSLDQSDGQLERMPIVTANLNASARRVCRRLRAVLGLAYVRVKVSKAYTGATLGLPVAGSCGNELVAH